MKKVRSVRILFLDNEYTAIALRCFKWDGVGIELGLIFVNADNPKNLSAKIRELTETEDLDLVIVGNNLGAGISQASAIADRLKPKTIVVWHVLGDITPYKDLGLSNFAERSNLREIILQRFGSN